MVTYINFLYYDLIILIDHMFNKVKMNNQEEKTKMSLFLKGSFVMISCLS